jgi:hypothetical protein
LPHDYLWVVPCAPNGRTQGSLSSLRNTRLDGKMGNLASQSLWCDAATIHINCFDVVFHHAIRMGAGTWCASCSLPSIAKPISGKTRSYGPGYSVALTVLWSGRRSW